MSNQGAAEAGTSSQPKTLTDSDLSVLLPTKPPDPLLVPAWGVVTAVDQLEVLLDGPCMDADGNEVDCTDPLNVVTPIEVFKTLAPGLEVGDRVWTVMSKQNLIVIGRSSSEAGTELGADEDLNSISTGFMEVSRQNLYPMPRTTTATGWAARYAGWTVGFSATGGAIPGTGWVSTVSPNTLTAVNRGLNWYQAPGEPWAGVAGNGLPVTPGDILTVSGYLYANKAGTFQVSLRAFNDDGAVGAELFGPAVSGTALTWTRINCSITVPEGATHLCGAFLVTSSVAWVTSDYIRVSSVLVDEHATWPTVVDPYFDGQNLGTGNPATATVQWEDEADNSISDLLLPSVNGGISTVYTQSSTAEATLALNYPEALAGVLEVFTNPGSSDPGSMIWQRYTPYGPYADHSWLRGSYQGTWSSWTRLGGLDTTSVEPVATSWDDILTPGLHPRLMHSQNNPGGPYPHSSSPGYYYVQTFTYQGNNRTQFAVPYGNLSNAPIAWRTRYNGVWYGWSTAGATVEGGSAVDAATKYFKKANGDLVCRGALTWPLVANTVYAYTWTFPVAFVGDIPFISIMANSTVPQNLTGQTVSSVGLTSAVIRVFRTTSSDTTVYIKAEGQWK